METKTLELCPAGKNGSVQINLIEKLIEKLWN